MRLCRAAREAETTNRACHLSHCWERGRVNLIRSFTVRGVTWMACTLTREQGDLPRYHRIKWTYRAFLAQLQWGAASTRGRSRMTKVWTLRSMLTKLGSAITISTTSSRSSISSWKRSRCLSFRGDKLPWRMTQLRRSMTYSMRSKRTRGTSKRCLKSGVRSSSD